jgi:hypothetical protein
MANKKENPAAVATAGGANGAVSKNTATIAQTGGKANIPVITSIRRRPYGKTALLVSIKGVCTDMPIRDQKLRRYRRFCAAIKYRCGVNFDPMPQAAWSAIVEAAIAAEGGVSC